jgi:hypothetical protein
MVIYTNNLAEKLFGFAMSREQLRDTALCGFLDDPRLTLDIDLAIDFNAAVRGDEGAAERFTNTLILSSAYVDYSTADFYTTRMEQYPVFEYHVDRITYIFDNLDNLGDYYANSNANERSFLDKLLDALKDCLNSPCNLFAASSESIASITDMAAKSNSSTIPSFQELKGKFKNAYGGLKTTLVKRLPDAVSDMFIELGTIGQGAWAQSVDMLYSKDPEKKKKIIDNALAGKALDSDSTSYSYIPDLDAFTSVEGFATSILSQAASDLGGCFRKYQHLARYSPFNPEQNLSRTNSDPVDDSVDGKNTFRNSFGIFPIDYQDRDLNVCKGGISGSATPDIAAPSTGTENQSDREKWLKGQKNISGRLPNGVNITSYGQPNDTTPDTNTLQKRGYRNNLLREGSVALSPDIYTKYNPQIGSSVYLNGQFVGYYEDRTPASFNGRSYYQTVDVYDPNNKIGPVLKNTGQSNITFGPPRDQISNP